MHGAPARRYLSYYFRNMVRRCTESQGGHNRQRLEGHRVEACLWHGRCEVTVESGHSNG